MFHPEGGSNITMSINTVLDKVSNLTSFVTHNLYLYIMLLASFFFIIQESIMYFKTKKLYHKLFFLGFSFILFSSVSIYLSRRIWKFPNNKGYFISGIVGIICFVFAFYYIMKAIKLKRLER